VPYGEFVYRVRFHRIVAASDLDVLRSHGREVVILQACHPRFFASHRYLVYAYPVRVVPRGGPAYALR
jgi:LPXTG-site transpeptidase (sortase) family protein